MISHKDDTICTNNEFKITFNDILENNASNVDDIKIINITELTDPLHTIADYISITDSSVFMRLCKQRIRAGFSTRDYFDNKASDVVPGNNESRNGIEICTYAYINFDLGLLELVGTKTAPNERFLNKFFTNFRNNYYIELLPIPTPHSLDALYNCENPKIKTLDLEIPIPNIGILSESLGWTDKEIESLVLNNDLKVSLCLKPLDNNRGSFVCSEDDSRNLIDIIKRKRNRKYSKASISGKEDNDNLRTYNFFEDNFGFKMNVTDHHTSNGNIISHSTDKLLEIYKSKMTQLFNENYSYFSEYNKEQ